MSDPSIWNHDVVGHSSRCRSIRTTATCSAKRRNLLQQTGNDTLRQRPLECGDLSPLFLRRSRFSISLSMSNIHRSKESGSAAIESGDKSPHSKICFTQRQSIQP